MASLSKILIKSITNVTKNVTKMEIALDDLIDQFGYSCPPKDELLKIVQQKNQLQTALQSVNGAFTTVQSTVDTTKKIIKAVDISIKTIKKISVPTSVYPLPGIPISVITVLADSLDRLGDILKNAKGTLKIVPSASKVITSASNSVLNKFKKLDKLLNVCLEELVTDIEWQPSITYSEGTSVTYNGDYYDSVIDSNLNNNPSSTQPPLGWVLTTKEIVAEKLALEVGNVAATAGNYSSIDQNLADEDSCLSRVSPGSTNPYIYTRRGSNEPEWLLSIEYDPNSQSTFPKRRIVARNINEADGNPFKGAVVYNSSNTNIAGGAGDTVQYSYSTSVCGLIEEIQFVIDQLDVLWWRTNNRSYLDFINQNLAEAIDTPGREAPPLPLRPQVNTNDEEATTTPSNITPG